MKGKIKSRAKQEEGGGFENVLKVRRTGRKLKKGKVTREKAEERGRQVYVHEGGKKRRNGRDLK